MATYSNIISANNFEGINSQTSNPVNNDVVFAPIISLPTGPKFYEITGTIGISSNTWGATFSGGSGSRSMGVFFNSVNSFNVTPAIVRGQAVYGQSTGENPRYTTSAFTRPSATGSNTIGVLDFTGSLPVNANSFTVNYSNASATIAGTNYQNHLTVSFNKFRIPAGQNLYGYVRSIDNTMVASYYGSIQAREVYS